MTYEFMGWHFHFLRKIETVKYACDDLEFYGRKMAEKEPFTQAMVDDIARAEKQIEQAWSLIRALRERCVISEAA